MNKPQFDDDSAALAHQAQLEQQQQLDQQVPATLAQAYVKAQAEFDNPDKNKSAQAGRFSYDYADLPEVINAIKKALSKYGLGYFQRFHHSENGVALETIIIHESGETMSNGIFFLPASKHDAQGFGGACTYARRYSLLAAFGIAPEDDDAAKASKQETKVDYKAERQQNLKSALADVSKAATEKDVADLYKRALKFFGKGTEELDEVIAACTKRKDELLSEAA